MTIQKAREALNKIASWTQTEGLLWWQVEARSALAALDAETVKGEWTTETGLPFGVKPRIYDEDGTLVAEVGNAETDKQDEWERNAARIVNCVNASGGLVACRQELAETRLVLDQTERNALALHGHALERVVKERDEARAELGATVRKFNCDNAEQFWKGINRIRARAESAEAKLAEARKVIERYESGLNTLATTFYKDDQHQDYAKHVLDIRNLEPRHD